MDLSRRDQPALHVFRNGRHTGTYKHSLVVLLHRLNSPSRSLLCLFGFGPLGGPVSHARSSTDIAVSVAFQKRDDQRKHNPRKESKVVSIMYCSVVTSRWHRIKSNLNTGISLNIKVPTPSPTLGCKTKQQTNYQTEIKRINRSMCVKTRDFETKATLGGMSCNLYCVLQHCRIKY